MTMLIQFVAATLASEIVATSARQGIGSAGVNKKVINM
jgi:hypothetical protein